jgi:cytochrome bd-type quinol oxidase subunit 1
MELDPVLLARIQFAFTVSFHIIFPTFTIGVAAYLATLEVLWGWTGAARYKRLAAVGALLSLARTAIRDAVVPALQVLTQAVA